MLETLQRHIVRQERLATVGLLLSGVAHELNNPLQSIMGASEVLERRADLSADAQEDVALISAQTQRAAEIIRNLSRFGTLRPALPAAIDVRDVVSEVVQLRRTDLEAAGIGCEVQIASTGKVFASFTELEQVVLNFVINAQQSIKAAGVEHGLIVIRSSDADTSVRLEVTDNGLGVPPEDESKLFQPFFTTKPVGEGTGLGLSVSHGIIERTAARSATGAATLAARRSTSICRECKPGTFSERRTGPMSPSRMPPRPSFVVSGLSRTCGSRSAKSSHHGRSVSGGASIVARPTTCHARPGYRLKPASATTMASMAAVTVGLGRRNHWREWRKSAARRRPC
jgi:hypothetical protein